MGDMPTPKMYVVIDLDHIDELFPQAPRGALRNACREMMLRSGGPVAVGLTPGQYKIWPIVNSPELTRRRLMRKVPLRPIRSGSSAGRAAD